MDIGAQSLLEIQRPATVDPKIFYLSEDRYFADDQDSGRPASTSGQSFYSVSANLHGAKQLPALPCGTQITKPSDARPLAHRLARARLRRDAPTR